MIYLGPMGSSPGVRGFTRRELFWPRRHRQEDEGGWIRVHRAAMACRFEILLDDADALHVGAAREALDEADRVEAVLTVFRATSETSRVNREAGGSVGHAQDQCSS